MCNEIVNTNFCWRERDWGGGGGHIKNFIALLLLLCEFIFSPLPDLTLKFCILVCINT